MNLSGVAKVIILKDWEKYLKGKVDLPPDSLFKAFYSISSPGYQIQKYN
jgi:hypothetical protein